MKIFIFIIFASISILKAQKNTLSIQCIEPQFINDNSNLKNPLITCGNTSPYYYNSNLYLPQLSDGVIYLKLNFIFLTKPDGTGNFEQNNQEHIQALDDVINRINYTLLNLNGQPNSSCIGYGQANQSNLKLQFIVNKVWKVDPAWDYLYTGYIPCSSPNAPVSCVNFNKLYPPSADYYYTYLDNDPTIPSGINIVFANNGTVYNEIVNNHNYTAQGGAGWAASQTPSNNNFSQKLRQFFPDTFNDYLVKKNYIADNPDPSSPYPNTPWSTVYEWFAYNLRGGILHETGHNFNLDHQNSCDSNIMNQCGTCSRDYLSNMEVSQIYFAASTTSVRQYFTENSFKNTSISSNSNQLWDLNFRLYSNVKIDNNSSLKATCKIIMAPESRVIVKNGSNFIIEGADISSANNLSWKGIKVEGNGYCLILPTTKIDNGYFHVYTDNSIITENKTLEENKNTDKENTKLTNENIVFKIFPNPTGDYLNIQSEAKIKLVKIYDFSGKEVLTLTQNLDKINVESIPSGSYILMVDFGNKKITKKFMKK